MPIAFPLGAIKEVEKVVEKIVEKVQYITRSLSPQVYISYMLISKSSLPSPAIASAFSTSISTINFANVLRLPLQIPSFYVVFNPNRPAPQSFISLSLSSRVVSSMSASKISISVSQIGKAPIPQPVTTINLAPSVGVRKSP